MKESTSKKQVRKTENTTKNDVISVKQNKSVVNNKKGTALSAKGKRNTGSMHAVRAVKVVNVRKKDKTPFPWSIVFTALILTSLFLFMMMNYAEVDKYNSEINELDNKIGTLEKTQKDLDDKLSKKYNLEDIQKYATDELGMVKKETLRSQYISIGQDDKTEMKVYDDGEEGGIGFLLTGLGEVIKDFIK